jgi:sec-independent protein translocase protein TatB
MFDIGWSEMVVVAVIALIVIGPKDLPRILRLAGRWAGKARAIARDFQNSLDEMVRESELDEVKKNVESAARYDVKKEVENAIDPTGVLTPNIEPTASDTAPDPAPESVAPANVAKEESSVEPSAENAPEDSATPAQSQASG